MKKIVLAMLACMCATSLWAQGTSTALLDDRNSLPAPASSIDFLKQSLDSSSVAAPAFSAKKSKTPADVPSSAQTVPAKSTANTAANSSNKTSYSSSKKQQPAAPKKTVPTPNRNAGKTASVKPVVVPAAVVTDTEKAIETQNALAEGERTGGPVISSTTVPSAPATQDEIAQEELDYAARILQQQRQTVQSGRFIPPAAAKTAHITPAPVTNKAYNPNEYRPGVEWQRKNTTHFIIYTQKREGGIGSSNMGMTFESAYTTLRRFIPWMMSDKVRVFVYQDHNSYLKHEPNAKAWTRALAYPTRGEIVVYDEPGKQQELKEVFTHELTHIFTQKYFDKHKTGRLMTPTWLDEGLAVYMEDQAYNGMKGGPWAKDLKTVNIQRSKESQPAGLGASRAKTFASKGTKRRGKPMYYMPFDQFMQEGSLASMESRNKTQSWYFQAYAMVRFLLNPAGGAAPSNRMQFEQFTRLMAQGEQVRDPSTGFPARDRNGKPVYQPYSVEKAMGRAYRYNNTANFEDAFWRWADTVK